MNSGVILVDDNSGTTAPVPRKPAKVRRAAAPLPPSEPSIPRAFIVPDARAKENMHSQLMKTLFLILHPAWPTLLAFLGGVGLWIALANGAYGISIAPIFLIAAMLTLVAVEVWFRRRYAQERNA